MVRKQKESTELTERFRKQFAKSARVEEGEKGEATERSSPIVLQETYQIRFDRADVKAMEQALAVGYPAFIRPGIFGSLTATEVYLWRGLREEDEKSELVHVFPLNDAGKEQAGDLLWSFMNAEGDMGKVLDGIVDGFIACGIARRKKENEPAGQKKAEGTGPKNLPT